MDISGFREDQLVEYLESLDLIEQNLKKEKDRATRRLASLRSSNGGEPKRDKEPAESQR